MEGLPKSLYGMIIAALIAIVAIVLIVINFNPSESSWVVFVMMFLSIFILLAGLSIPFFYFYRFKKGTLEVINIMPESIMRGLILSVVLTILLIMQTIHVLTWWNGLSVIVIAVILDMYFKH